MNFNPYQSPAPAEPLANSISAVPTIADRFDDEQRTRLLAGLALVARGHLVILLCAIVYGFSAILRLEGPLAVDSINALLVLFGVGTGLVVKGFGVAKWFGLPGVEKTFSLLAIVLQSIGMVATGSFVIATMNGRVVGGLFPLFGASAFSMLLISQAIISLVNRSWAVSLHDKVAVIGSELAVVGYAACASMCASNAMNLIPRRGQLTGFAVATVIAGIVPLALQMAAHQKTYRTMARKNGV